MLPPSDPVEAPAEVTNIAEGDVEDGGDAPVDEEQEAGEPGEE